MAAIAAIALLVISAVTSMTTIENVFAKKYNQAKSNVNNCGNGVAPTNIGCQNIDSQIQGDENSVALAAQQTFPAEVVSPPPSRTCEECFDLLEDGNFGIITDNLGIADEEEICDRLEAGTLTLADIEEAIPPNLVDEPDVISFLECLEAIFGSGGGT